MNGIRAAMAAVPFILFVAFSCFGGGAPGRAPGKGAFPVRVSNGHPDQGEPVIVDASPPPGTDSVVMVWKGLSVPMKREPGGRFLGLIGVDLLEKPGRALLTVWAARRGETLRADVELSVRGATFPVQKLTLPKAMTEFDRPTLDRIRKEAARLKERFSRVSSPPAWRFPFRPPVREYHPKGFGARRIINGEPRSPHAGVDVILPAGTPVMAIADGTVAFAGTQFFGGNSVVLDHGAGVFSVYYHLQTIAVSEGQPVSRGEVIGSVGSSGRATGAHLHFSVRAPGGRIDPSSLFEASSR